MELITKELDMAFITKELEDKGYCIIPDILSESEIGYAKEEFNKWKINIPDKVHQTIDPHGIYKHHRAGHTKHAWFIRTRPKVQKVFQMLLRSKRMHTYVASSFKFIDETALFGKLGQYHFVSLPVTMEHFCGTISKIITTQDNKTRKWPGGTRRLGSTIG